MFAGFNIFPDDVNRPFSTQYRAFSVSMLPGNERDDVERGGKIIMPPSALDTLTRLNITYPMLFKLTNTKQARTTHCGVLEFVADEGRIFLPHWMMMNMLLEEGDMLRVDSVALPVAKYSKFQPQSIDFLDISNPKAVLENSLRNHACLSKGDMVGIYYNEKIYEVAVLEVQPGNAVSIIECDMNVEFAAPVGYNENQPMQKPSRSMVDHDPQLKPEDYIDKSKFRAFSGFGTRIDGKDLPDHISTVPIHPSEMKRGVPNYEYKPGTLNFIRTGFPTQAQDASDETASFKPFEGEGQVLRPRR